MKVAVLQCSCSVGAAVNVEEVGVEEDAVLFFPRFIRDRAANDICRWTAVETDWIQTDWIQTRSRFWEQHVSEPSLV